MKKKHIVEILHHLCHIVDSETGYGTVSSKKEIWKYNKKRIRRIQKLLAKHGNERKRRKQPFRLDLAGLVEGAYQRARSAVGESQEAVGREKPAED